MSNIDERKPWLSDTIDYDRDIEPYQFIKIYAGVGSGKNTFVDNLVKGNIFKHSDGSMVERKHVLLVTSRRAKADEQRHSPEAKYDKKIGIFDDSSAAYWFDYDTRCEYECSDEAVLPDFGGLVSNIVKLRSCACTNAQIERAWEEYIPRESVTHPWERFDIIVIDEVHAVLADATYQSAPYYVRLLIEETLKRQTKCKVIVMTGSPEILSNYKLFDNAYCIDRMEECENLTPKNIVFLSVSQAKNKVVEMAKSGEKLVYFANRIKHINNIIAAIPIIYHEHIAASFSDPKKRAMLMQMFKEVYKNMNDTEKSLVMEQKIPENVHVFLTNARNKEGINIKNMDIKTMFIEAHVEIDVKQMVGRLREGVETLYIVVNAPLVDDNDIRGELDFTLNSNLLNEINSYFMQINTKESYFEIGSQVHKGALGFPKLRDYIHFIHDKFPYVRFNYSSYEFVFYPERQQGKAYYANQAEIFSDHYSSKGLCDLAAKWFPTANCKVIVPFNDDIQQAVKEFLERRRCLVPGKRITRNDQKMLHRALEEMTGIKRERLGDLLRIFGYRTQRVGKSSKGEVEIKIIG